METRHWHTSELGTYGGGKTYLAQTYGKKIGKASVTGYCIKFKMLKDINIDILEAAKRMGWQLQTYIAQSRAMANKRQWAGE